MIALSPGSPLRLLGPGLAAGLSFAAGVGALDVRSSADTRWRRSTFAFSSSGTPATAENADSSGWGVNVPSRSGVPVRSIGSLWSLLSLSSVRDAVRFEDVGWAGSAALLPRPDSDDPLDAGSSPLALDRSAMVRA